MNIIYNLKLSRAMRWSSNTHVPAEIKYTSYSPEHVSRATLILKRSLVDIFSNFGHVYGRFFKRDPSSRHGFLY